MRPHHITTLSSDNDTVPLMGGALLPHGFSGQSDVFLPGDTIINCCSNFHKLLTIFLGNGYGAGPINNFECLQDNENPAYRVCCQWTKTLVRNLLSGN